MSPFLEAVVGGLFGSLTGTFIGGRLIDRGRRRRAAALAATQQANAPGTIEIPVPIPREIFEHGGSVHLNFGKSKMN